jgi:phosphatidylinositol glycan class A protein
MLHGVTLGKKLVFTDHSLFGFNDAASININKVLKWSIADVDACICVSHINKDNLVLRAAIDPSIIYVIPNAVDTTRFQPDTSLRNPANRINIVVVSRMMYRKGVDLLIDIIPEIIRKYPDVYFIIGGDGDKLPLIHAMKDKYNLADRMEILGRVPHHKVRDVLCRGHIFLNTSLTEAFCIAILEAASCGLLCVSTNVGGVPEVLPPDMVYLAPARPKPMIQQLEKAINNYKNVPS